MADLKISDLPTDIVTLADGDKFPVADASALTANTYATALEIKDYCGPDTYVRALSSDYTLTSTTAAQAMFPAPGAVVLPVGFYEAVFFLALTNLSATSGNFAVSILGGTGSPFSTSFSILGSTGIDGTGSAASQTGTWTVGSIVTPGNIVSASTATSAFVRLRCSFNVTSPGQFAPLITLSNTSAAVVKAGSYVKIERLCLSSTGNRGDWVNIA